MLCFLYSIFDIIRVYLKTSGRMAVDAAAPPKQGLTTATPATRSSTSFSWQLKLIWMLCVPSIGQLHPFPGSRAVVLALNIKRFYKLIVLLVSFPKRIST